MINKNIRLIYSEMGERILIGIELPKNNIKTSQEDIEQVYNFFYNYGLTDGLLHTIIEGQFGYFTISRSDLSRVSYISSKLTDDIVKLLKLKKEEPAYLRSNYSNYVYNTGEIQNITIRQDLSWDNIPAQQAVVC